MKKKLVHKRSGNDNLEKRTGSNIHVRRKQNIARRCAAGCQQYVFLWFTGCRRFFFIAVSENRLISKGDDGDS